jgi:hypothetical protein
MESQGTWLLADHEQVGVAVTLTLNDPPDAPTEVAGGTPYAQVTLLGVRTRSAQ